MRESILETLVGLVVIAVAAAFLWFTLARGGDASTPQGYAELGVRFNSASGIERGTDVRMAGVKIGTVRNVGLDVDRAEALVTMAVDDRVLPLGDGTTARIQSESLLGGSYINLEPADGFADILACGAGEALFDGSGCGEVLYAQGAIDLMTLFASFATGSGGDAEE
jgi:phospholipid/cholesterol/gamma-HCH transport system substrate-binding protein